MRSQPWPRSWNANRSSCIPCGVAERLEARVAVEQLRERRVERRRRPARAPPRRSRGRRRRARGRRRRRRCLRRSRKRSARVDVRRAQRLPAAARRARRAPSPRRARAARPRSGRRRRRRGASRTTRAPSVERRPLDLRADARADVRADARRRAHPRRRQQHRHVALSRARGISSRRKTPRRLGVELGLAELVELDAASRSGASSVSCCSRSPHGSPSRTNAKPSSPCAQQRDRQAERRVVVGVQPLLEQRARRGRAARRGAGRAASASRGSPARPRSTQRESRRSSVA